MKTAKTHLRLSLLGALLCLARVGASAAAPPVESFISPGHLFPVEGTAFFLTTGEGPGAYQPLPAYDKPGGRVIGEVVLQNLHCVTLRPTEDCEKGLTWALNLSSGKSVVLKTAEYSYGTQALVSYGKSIDAPNGTAWSVLNAPKGAFWVRTAKVDVHKFEALADFVEELEQWCTIPGKCAPPSAEMNNELERVRTGQVVLSTCTSGYDITGIVTRGGKRYYRLERPELDARSAPTSLPKVGFTPTRNKAGGHTGAFSPRGC